MNCIKAENSNGASIKYGLVFRSSTTSEFRLVVENFYRHLNKRFTTKEIEDWLSRQDSYTLHKPVRRRFPRRKIYAKCIDDSWQADLADVSSLSKDNDNYKFLLTCIDVLSKYAWVIPSEK